MINVANIQIQAVNLYDESIRHSDPPPTFLTVVHRHPYTRQLQQELRHNDGNIRVRCRVHSNNNNNNNDNNNPSFPPFFLLPSIFRRRSLPLSLPSHAREFEPSARKVAARSDITLMSRLLTTPSLATVIVDAYTRGYENRSFVHDWKGGVILVSQYTTYTFFIDRRKIEIHLERYA